MLRYAAEGWKEAAGAPRVLVMLYSFYLRASPSLCETHGEPGLRPVPLEGAAVAGEGKVRLGDGEG